METPVDNVKAAAEAEEALSKTDGVTPTRKRYSRAQLMHIRETIDLSAPPVGYNPATCRPVEAMGKEMGPVARDGKNWNRSRSMGGWAAQNQGGVKGGGGGGLPFGRMTEATEDQSSGQPRGGRALRSAISWNEQQAAGAIPALDKAFSRRNSRSDAPGRWDNNKDEQLSKSLEKRGSEKWMSYGHRDSKDKPPKPGREDECIENLPQEPYRGHEPEWMHHKPSAENTERMKQHRQFAADFEEERKLMRQRIAKEPKERSSERGENPMLMTDEQINDYKKELEAEERGMSSSAFTFDSLKEAIKSQGVSNLPPMPTTGITSVDQIEKTLKASATAQQQRVPVPDVEKQKQLELLKAMSGGAPGNMANPAVAGGKYEGASRLLSMLRGQTRPPVNFPNMNPGAQLQQPMGGFPMNVPQQAGLFSSPNTQLERLFAANPRMGTNLGLMVQSAQQQPQMQPAMGNAQPLPFMQAGNQFAQRGAPSYPLLPALLVNSQQQQQMQSAQQKQAQIMAHLQQAQQQTPLPTAAGAEAGLKAAHENAKDDSGEPKTSPDGASMQQPGLMGLLPGGSGPVPNQMPLHSFGLQGNLMGNRSAAPGMFNPPMANLQTGGNPQESLFPGAMPGSVNPAIVGGHPTLYMQNGGGMGRPMGPGLSGLNLSGLNPAAMGSGGLGPVMDERQLPGLNGQPNALHANLLSGQQNNSGVVGGSLNRFFVDQEGGGAGTFSTDQSAVAPARNRSLEELKNEAQ